MRPNSFRALWKRLATGLLLASHVLGMSASAAERSGGLVAWGMDSSFRPAWVPPEARRGVVAVAAFESLTIAVKEDGSLVAWGAARRDFSSAFNNLPPIRAVALGISAVLLSRDGEVFQRWWDGTELAPPFPSRGFVAIADGTYHQMALRASGEVVCWGRNESGEATVPEGLEGVQAIAAGYNHSVALRKDGTVVAWGSNAGGQTSVPPNLRRVVAIAAGHLCTLALQDDGTVAVWGIGLPQPPAELSGVTGIATANGRALAIRQDGSVVSWDLGREPRVPTPGDLAGVMAVALGGTFSVALGELTPPVIDAHPADVSAAPWQTAELHVRAHGFDLHYQWLRDGQPIRWATNASLTIAGTFVSNAGGEYTVRVSNELGTVTSKPAVLAVIPGEAPRTVVQWGNAPQSGLAQALSDARQDLVAVATGGYHQWEFVIALRSDGTVVGWGNNERLQTSVPSGLTDVRAIAAGADHAVALTGSGRVAIWGSLREGGLVPIQQASDVTSIAAGAGFTLALKTNGELVELGNSGLGLAREILPRRTRLIAAGEAVGLAVTEDGQVFAKSLWLDGATSPVISNAPPRLQRAVQIVVGDWVGCALNDDGTLHVWAPPELVNDPRIPTITDATSIAAAEKSLLVLRRDGTVLHLDPGAFDLLEPPAGRRGEYALLEPPAGLGDVVAISAGGLRASAIGRPTAPRVRSELATHLVPQWQTEKLSVDAYGFGLNYLWYHGDRPLIGETNATLVLPAVRNADAGDYFVKVSNAAGTIMHPVAALHVTPMTEAGTVVTWGAWTDDLHEGTGERAKVPERLTGVRHISAGVDHDVVVMGDNTLRSWGRFYQFNAPSAPTLSGVVSVATSAKHAVALLDTGAVACWGFNDDWECNVPPDLTNAVAVAAGPGFSMAIRENGTLVTWGRNWIDLNSAWETLDPLRAVSVFAGGAVAALRTDGSVVLLGKNHNAPEMQIGQLDAVAIAAGAEHLLSLNRNGVVRATIMPWANGGPRGGNFEAAHVPRGLTNVIAIAAGDWYSMALKADGTVTAWGEFSTLWTIESESPEPPAGLSGVSAIAAGTTHALALLGPTIPPTLRIVTRPGGVTVQWPVTAGRYRLETTSRLDPAAWLPEASQPQATGGWQRLFLTPAEESRYYRLTSP